VVVMDTQLYAPRRLRSSNDSARSARRGSDCSAPADKGTSDRSRSSRTPRSIHDSSRNTPDSSRVFWTGTDSRRFHGHASAGASTFAVHGSRALQSQRCAVAEEVASARSSVWRMNGEHAMDS
jgi:hypothetical protein